ncbi:MAG: bifunctional [glutamine synthetase] adenylyltransferase/[glutamine synthetase]-adenylyl-L-tyrosine phosphorylase [Gluconacetobacter sp.]|uniref:Bifunctional [glutamine synthetase] adenylyltransferase/[glutamine synthetase]-adenylyl-L-tyrosine phosphorylase n=1 Tax=Gluconacetobacter dulcium TaxID=2729096 RepID=A0A7W4JWR8_9PROT|nr:bifunctional [glutamine synthetase] adenylyltransferase/[glutamine synthetase]-adenylyl-L-tyrosine phosphorylase [Gluconacetobacter dulcium]MBB2196144.1 bifunctional [glutamine synthetase] adenylyltransferase/[glutamine synthetase]-adenylyl-L-tyrosine phosphorylase [Gluconacetobacter dulcium]
MPRPRTARATPAPPACGPAAWTNRAWPAPADPRGAGLLREDLDELWQEHALDPDLLHAEGVAAMLAAVGGNSPYLAGLIRRDAVPFARLLAEGPDAGMAAALDSMAALTPRDSHATIAATLRAAKRQAALAIALADIGNLWTLEQVTLALSRLAEGALEAAVRHLLQTAHDTGQLILPDPTAPSRGSGFVVLAMGKLGARELNYSSDIDLIVLYDPDCHPGHEDLRRIFIRMTSDLVSLMEARDADGYVFRTDLRLRPDPSATPPAISFPAAIAYYESMGQTWERAAMTKARPVAGDIGAGRRFLRAIHPFVWRRHLDFAVIDDLHDMKARIDRHRNAGHSGLSRLTDRTVHDPGLARDWLLGHNLKLGQGGIREVEFVAQALQLVWGGREPELRDPTTLGALRRLVRAGILPRPQGESLARTYRMLRRAEHRLQMQADHQTHSLPATRETFNIYAIFMQEESGRALAAMMLPIMQESRRIFERQFAEPEGAEASIDPEAEDMAEHLRGAGFAEADIPDALALLGRWSGNRLRALRSDRARSLLRRLMPALLSSFGQRREPLTCLRRFDAMLSRQWAGVQFLSLLERNPALIGRIATILDGSAFLADHLAETPAALEGLLGGIGDDETDARIADLPPAQLVRQHVAAATSTEQLLPVLRTLVRGEEFRLSSARLEHRMDVDSASRARTDMADAVIRGLLRTVTAEHRERYGRIPGGAMVVVALGKAGSREMMPGSDLDLMLIYDHPAEVTESVIPSRGAAHGGGLPPRPLPVGQYFVRLAHAFIAALTAPGPEGPLYEVDMRLRPSGSKGPVALSLDSFRRYHAESAWTWERMALTRARVVAGAPPLVRAMRAAIGTALDGTRSPAARQAILDDASAMRARIARELPPEGPWDIRRRPGGLMDVEFIAQTLQLVAGTAEARSPCTREALRLLARHGDLPPAAESTLLRADRLWRSVQSMLRILFGTRPPTDPATIPAATSDILLREIGVASMDEALGLMDDLARSVRALFVTLVGPVEDPAERLRTPANPSK